MLGPSGPRRLRLSVEHLAQYRGGICFCVDLDPRWVIKLIKKGWSEHLQAYKDHVIDQAVTILQAEPRHPLHVHDAQAARVAGAEARVDGHVDPQDGHHRHLLGRHRVHAAVESLRPRGTARRRLHDADLRQHADGAGRQRAERAAQRLQDHLLRTAAARGHRGRRLRRSGSRWSTTGHRTRQADDADAGSSSCRASSSATKASASRPTSKYPWDGISGVRPFRGFASTTTVGVY